VELYCTYCNNLLDYYKTRNYSYDYINDIVHYYRCFNNNGFCSKLFLNSKMELWGYENIVNISRNLFGIISMSDNLCHGINYTKLFLYDSENCFSNKYVGKELTLKIPSYFPINLTEDLKTEIIPIINKLLKLKAFV